MSHMTWRHQNGTGLEIFFYWLGYIVTENSMHTIDGENQSVVLSNCEVCVIIMTSLAGYTVAIVH